MENHRTQEVLRAQDLFTSLNHSKTVKVIDKLGDHNGELVNLFLSATPQHYCAFLQLPYYYENLNELNYQLSTGESSPLQTETNTCFNNLADSLRHQLDEPSRSEVPDQRDYSDLEGEGLYLETFKHHKYKKAPLGPKY